MKFFSWKTLTAFTFFLFLGHSLLKADLRSPTWFDSDGVSQGSDWHYRVPITISSGNQNDHVFETIDFADLLNDLGVTGTFDQDSIRLVKEDGQSLITTFEFDFVTADSANVEFVLEDNSPVIYYLYFDITENATNPKTALNNSLSTDWYNEDWSARMPITIDYSSGTVDIDDYIFSIEIDNTYTDFWNQVQSQGQDIRIVDGDGTELPIWVEAVDTTEQQANIWLRLEQTLLAGESETLYLYYGNSSVASVSNQEETFTYTTAKPVAINLNYTTTTTDVSVVSYFDDNEIIWAADLNCTPVSQVTLNEGDTHTFAAVGMGDVFCATKPFVGRGVGNRVDMLTPLHFASTELIFPTTRGTNSLTVYSPFGNASINTYLGSTNNTTGTSITQGTALNLNTDATGTNAIWLESDFPVLANHYASYDAYVAYPQTTNLYGISSRNAYMASTHDDSFNITVDGSAQASCTTCTLNPNQVTLLKSLGNSQGNGPVYHLTASHPFSAIQQSDLDGSETTTFLPYEALGKKYYLPTSAEYISVVCTGDGTTVDLTIFDDGSIETQTCDANELVYFNAANYAAASNGNFDAGSSVTVSTGDRVYLYYEDFSTNDETNLWSVKAHQQITYPEPQISLSTVTSLANVNIESPEGFGLEILTLENTNGESLSCGDTLVVRAQSDVGQDLGVDNSDTLEVQILTPSGDVESLITLFDDATHGDVTADDGIYSNSEDFAFADDASAGTWSLTVSAGFSPTFDNGYEATDSANFDLTCQTNSSESNDEPDDDSNVNENNDTTTPDNTTDETSDDTTDNSDSGEIDIDSLEDVISGSVQGGGGCSLQQNNQASPFVLILMGFSAIILLRFRNKALG